MLVGYLAAADNCNAEHCVQRSEISDQRSDGFKMKEVGTLIMVPSIAPTSRHFSVKIV